MIFKFILSFVLLTFLLWGVFEGVKRVPWTPKLVKTVLVVLGATVLSAGSMFIIVQLF